jgi:hypothetical protein
MVKEVEEAKKLANKYRDEAYSLMDKNEGGFLYFYFCGPWKRKSFCWEQFEYYSKIVRDYYKKYPQGTLLNGNF